MPLSRKSFLRYASVLAGSWSSIEAFAARPTLATPEDDVVHNEAYWRTVREAFPLSRDWAYLNNGTLGPSPYPVIEAVHAGMMESDRMGVYNGYEETVKKLAAFVGAEGDEIALTHNVTEGINIACWGSRLKRGDEVILTTHEHVGNAFPWLNRQKLHGIVLRTYTPAPTADETLNRIAALINKKTRVIATPHIPCTQGQVLPVKEICTLARQKGLHSLIDGAHGPGMMPIDLHDMGCDTYASCCHKWMLGPKGTGFLYVRKDFQKELQAYFVGGGGDTGVWNMATVPITTTEYAPSAHRYFGGTQSLGLWKGVEAAIGFIDTIGIEHIHSRIKSLGAYTQESLLQLGDRIELLTPIEERSRCAVTGFRIKKMPHDQFFKLCMENKVRIRGVAENGLASLRVSTHIYNSKSDVDKLMELVRKVA